jgi:DNA-binding transcriptional ArsR family regulator
LPTRLRAGSVEDDVFQLTPKQFLTNDTQRSKHHDGPMAARIHFTPADLMRIRLRPRPSPVREALSSTTLLRLPPIRQGHHSAWVSRARNALRPGMRPWLELNPGMLAATLDFVGRTELRPSLPHALDDIRATPRGEIERGVGELSRDRRLPGWVHHLADPDGHALAGLTRAMDVYFQAVLSPSWDAIEHEVERDHAFRVRTLTEDGAEGLLRSLAPVFQWRPPILHWDQHHETLPAEPGTIDIHLAGRGLILMPTVFWSGLAVDDDPARTPILTFPIPGAALTVANHDDEVRLAAIAGLLGHTRAAVLRATVVGRSTSELAADLGIALGSASEHAKTLRRAGLVTSQRHGNTVRHYVTPLGRSLLNDVS